MKVSIIWGWGPQTSDQILEAFRFISSALVLCRSRDERLKCCFHLLFWAIWEISVTNRDRDKG
jgi:hypothetical protein